MMPVLRNELVSTSDVLGFAFERDVGTVASITASGIGEVMR